MLAISHFKSFLVYSGDSVRRSWLLLLFHLNYFFFLFQKCKQAQFLGSCALNSGDSIPGPWSFLDVIIEKFVFPAAAAVRRHSRHVAARRSEFLMVVCVHAALPLYQRRCYLHERLHSSSQIPIMPVPLRGLALVAAARHHRRRCRSRAGGRRATVLRTTLAGGRPASEQ